MGWFLLIVGALLLLVGTPIALVWWQLAKKAAPYRDEGAKAGANSRVGKDESEVIVVLPSGESRAGDRRG